MKQLLLSIIILCSLSLSAQRDTLTSEVRNYATIDTLNLGARYKVTTTHWSQDVGNSVSIRTSHTSNLTNPQPMQSTIAAMPAVAQAPAATPAQGPVSKTAKSAVAQAAKTAAPALRSTVNTETATTGAWDSQVAVAEPAK